MESKHPQNSITQSFNQLLLMADIPKNQSSPLQSSTSQHQILEEDERISSLQTLDVSDTNCSSLAEDDDLVNIDDGGVRYSFIVDPFSPLDSSFLVPHRDHRNQQVNSNLCSCCSSEPESESDCTDSTVYHDCLDTHDEEYDEMHFVDDLFDSRGEIEHVSGRLLSTDVGISVSEDAVIINQDDGFASNHIEELGLGLGYEDDDGSSYDFDSDSVVSNFFEASVVNDQDDYFVSNNNSNTEGLGLGYEDDDDSRYESDSDTVDTGHNSWDSRYELNSEHSWDCPPLDSEASVVNDQDDYFVSNNNSNTEGLGLGYEDNDGSRYESDSDTVDTHDSWDSRYELNLEHSWDCPPLDSARVNERDGSSSVIDRIEEISASSNISSEGDAAVRVLEWEILLAVNSLERDLESATDGGEGFVYTPEFDTLIGQFVDAVRASRGTPPAAKSFIDGLPLVVLKNGDAKEDDGVTCAVCKDEISMDEQVTQLPCMHHYHGECILPWLSIRNTCPVCRFELPTDDVDYERSKNRGDDDQLRVGYGFDLSP